MRILSLLLTVSSFALFINVDGVNKYQDERNGDWDYYQNWQYHTSQYLKGETQPRAYNESYASDKVKPVGYDPDEKVSYVNRQTTIRNAPDNHLYNTYGKQNQSYVPPYYNQNSVGGGYIYGNNGMVNATRNATARSYDNRVRYDQRYDQPYQDNYGYGVNPYNNYDRTGNPYNNYDRTGVNPYDTYDGAGVNPYNTYQNNQGTAVNPYTSYERTGANPYTTYQRNGIDQYNTYNGYNVPIPSVNPKVNQTDAVTQSNYYRP